MRRHGRAGKGQDVRDVRVRRLALGTLVPALLVLVSCKGETLYGPAPEGVVPPAVSVVAPLAGAQVLAGRSFPVRVVAADTLGIKSIQIEYSGAASGVLRFDVTPPQTRVQLDTVVLAPAGSVGRLDVKATATNVRNASATTDAVAVEVSAADQVAPFVSVTALVPGRFEATDSVVVHVRGADNPGGSGLATLGATVVSLKGTRPDTQLVAFRTRTLSPTRSDTVAFDVVIPASAIGGAVGDTLPIQVYGFAVDSAGNCSATSPGANGSSLCANRTISGTSVRLAPSAGPPVPAVRVGGRSFTLPSGAVIADVVADQSRGRVYLSNLRANEIELFDVNRGVFGTAFSAGAQPWGMALNLNRDTLIVANSGGTNVSFVALNGTPQEATSRRIRTPNALLFEVKVTKGSDNLTHYSATFIDFSDRPQFVAEDAAGRLLYSTVPTRAAPDGTIRVATMQPGWQQPEVRMLLSGGTDLVTGTDTTTYSIAHVDSLRVFLVSGNNDLVEIYDHAPGFPNQIIRSGLQPIAQALDSISRAGSDVAWALGHWNLRLVGLSDTTFVAASGDHQYVAFGEGATAAGRVFLWSSPTGSISNEITVADLVGNSSEHLLSVDLSGDGSVGVVRGLLGAYYFIPDLRLQGSTVLPASGGAGNGAVLDPAHPSFGVTPGTHTLSFVASASKSIGIYETVHYSKVGEIPLRDNIVGPLRVSTPLSSACTAAGCPLATLYGVTSAGALVVVNVFPSDVH